MKHLTLLCVAEDGEGALEALRELGCAHVDLSGASSAAFAEAKGELADAERAVRILAKAAKEADAAAADGRFESVRNADLVSAVLKADEERQSFEDAAEALRQTVLRYEPYGDFDPELAKSLLDRGIDLSSVAELPDPLPTERLSVTKRKLAEAEASACAVKAALAALSNRVGAILDRYPELKDRVSFEAARDRLTTQGVVSWIEGWVPQDAVPKLRAKAVTMAWGVLLRDAAPEENPPTLIRPPKLFRPVAALFDGLGVAPAYTESDVSVPFMCYFSVFFAMLVGDGAYGAIFLLATLFGWWKTCPKAGEGHRPRVVRSWLTLMSVFSFATVVWGVLSNTWFGAGIPWCADWPTVKWLADPSYRNMMLLCFTIGVSHLMVARIWNGVCKFPDSTSLAEFGWAGVLLLMYLVTNSIVGIFPGVPQWGFWVGGVSIALIFLFTVKPSELKTRGAELGMLPLNIMSALGDIISYVRLFAVGLASVKVAENFNSMATGLVAGEQSWWVTALMAIAMVAILLIGHGLNLAMAGLSILVHAVRLNTLEFSNHKGVSWAGYAFSPFRREDSHS
ncbi:MAG: hypothetical protein Q4G65_18520 [bacterium]|nr:hypothetical protein [bacterium]